ncbi:MAG: dihydroorotate dehydrogenase electron transfer subunit [Clostridiaceae bacterium]|nr:dihydroorotate dehydrogenase electron transfer subunit [Clostridiaceae bacterium]
MPLVLKEEIIFNKELVPGIFELAFISEYVSQRAKPGQFVNIKCCDGLDTILRRPLSICSVNRKNNTVIVAYRETGKGTRYLARKKAGDKLDLIGPLGNWFHVSDEYKSIAVVGGGIGVFPLLFLLQQNPCAFKGAYIGFESNTCIVMEKEFLHCSDKIMLATNDGSKGFKGFVTDLLALNLLQEGSKGKINGEKYDIIYACGPMPMMKKVFELASKMGIKCQVSLEQRMGCGIGACLACACKVKHDGDWHYKRVCKDGPVFWGEEVDFDG